jgi:hypothetical protein
LHAKLRPVGTSGLLLIVASYAMLVHPEKMWFIRRFELGRIAL